MVRQSDLVVWLKDVDREDIHLVGEKSANIGEMIQNKFPVPPGFVITAAAYTFFIRENKLEKPISHLLHSINYNDPNSIAQVSRHIKNLLTSAPFPQELSKQIFRYYERLDPKKANPSVAVRTSILAKHTAMPSSVIPHDSLLNIHGESSVAHAIREVWSTLYDANALQYRHHHNEREDAMKTALIIQEMIDSDKSGVAFTVHPFTGDKRTLIIEAIFGLGDHLKNKGVIPDQYILTKEPLLISDKKISSQRTLLVNAKLQYKEVAVQKKAQNSQKLSDDQILAVAEMAKKLEKHYFYPQDIEWSIEGGKLYIIETRPFMLKENRPIETPQTSPKLFSQSHSVSTLLIGEPGSPGIGVGPIKIVNKISEVNSFLPGEVFVAKSTSAMHEPAMRRASAIIVEEGGRSSHTTYMARQFGVPAVIEVPNARKVLKNGLVVTVKGSSGEVLKGNLKLLTKYSPNSSDAVATKTSVYVEIDNTAHTERILSLPVKGVGDLSADTVIKSYGIHPKKVLHDKKTQEYTSFLAKEVGKVAKMVYPNPLIFSLSNGSTNMYRGLQGGRDFEPAQEENQISGYRGSFRHISDPRMLELELSVIRSVRSFGYNNVHIRVPFVRSVREFENMKQLIHKAGFRRSATCAIWMTCATPGNVLELDDYIRSGLDGVFIDAAILSHLITGYDRNNSEVAPGVNDMDSAVLQIYEQILSQCKKKKISVIFNGSNISLTHDLLEKLVEWNVQIISVLPESVHHTRENILRIEKKGN